MTQVFGYTPPQVEPGEQYVRFVAIYDDGDTWEFQVRDGAGKINTIKVPASAIGWLAKSREPAADAAAGTGWRPMSSAPTDGTPIIATLTVRDTGGDRPILYWEKHIIAFDEEAGGLVENLGWDWSDYEYWQPVPADPDIVAPAAETRPLAKVIAALNCLEMEARHNTGVDPMIINDWYGTIVSALSGSQGK